MAQNPSTNCKLSAMQTLGPNPRCLCSAKFNSMRSELALALHNRREVMQQRALYAKRTNAEKGLPRR